MATGFQSEGMTTRCLRRAFDEVPIGLAILSGQPEHCGHVVDLNPYMADLFGCRPAELLSRSLAEHLQPSDHLPYEELVASVLATHQPASRELRTAPAAGGSGRYLALSASVVRDPAGGPSHIVVTAEDVGRRRDAEGRLIYQALHDPVTGLPNRLLFADRVGQALARAHGRGHLAVMVIDLDRFALVNESLGHAGGDRVLEETGRRLRATAGPAAGVARLGSDEFLVVVEGLDDEYGAEAAANRIGRAIAEPIPVDGFDLVMSAAIGIAVASEAAALEGQTPEDLIAGAKLAMQQVKQRPTGGHAVFQADMQPQGVGRLEIASRLQRAVRDHELRVVYQPLYSLVTGRIVGAEALVRWHHPTWGVVAPLDFLPVAEETGVIVPVGGFVLESACAQARAWQRAGNDLVIAVNVSARELADPDLTERVMSALRTHHLTPRHLCLEITESVLVAADGSAGATAQALRELGVSLAIDDFGTGYSSLAYVKRFPVDTIKVDRSFVDGIDLDGREAAIVERVADLAHALDMSCVAEGVETRAQLDRLRQLGCDAAQGFLLGRPVDAATLSARLDGRRSETPPTGRGQVFRGQPSALPAS